MNLNFTYYIDQIIQNWPLSLGIGLVALILAKYLKQIAVVFTGYIIGTYIILPYILMRFPQMRDVMADPKTHVILEIVIGVVSAAILYAAFKVVIFLAAFIAIGGMAYYAFVYLGDLINLNSLFKDVPLKLGIIYLILSAAAGVLGGYLAQKREEELVVFMAITSSSLILSVVLSYLILRAFGEDVRSTLGMYVILGMFIVLFLLGVKLNFGKLSWGVKGKAKS